VAPYSLEVARSRTGDREVAGSSLTHCAAEYGRGQAAHSHLPLSASSIIWGNSLEKLRQPRSDAYSAQQVLLNKQQMWCGGAYLDCYLIWYCSRDAVMLRSKDGNRRSGVALVMRHRLCGL